jgi:hypothetical protein
VPRKTLQIEVGYGMGIPDGGSVSFDNAPGVLIRYSPAKIFEIRVNINYVPMSTHFSRSYSHDNLFEFGVGGKLKICKEKKFRPELAVEGLVTFPSIGFTQPDAGWIGGEVYVLANQFFTKWLYINYNAGYMYGNRNLQHSFAYSACAGFILHRYVELFIEHFGFIHNHDVPDWGVDGGICIFPTPRLQIDFSYIRLFNGFGNQNNLSLGVSYNIGFGKDHYKNLFWKK